MKILPMKMTLTKNLSVGFSAFIKVSLDPQLEKLVEDQDLILCIFSKRKCSLFLQLSSLQFLDHPSWRIGSIIHKPRIQWNYGTLREYLPLHSTPTTSRCYCTTGSLKAKKEIRKGNHRPLWPSNLPY